MDEFSYGSSINMPAKFWGEGGEVSPLTQENYNLFQLCGIALCIIHMSIPAIPF
ncbi:putative pectinesterase inhibitor 2 [Sesbania bispinosa]|nr:putative pectinesterase inhibitor 2 [Sesbania bispinosa]